MTTNPLVDFLASYGPQPSSNNLYDEFVVEAARRTGCAPLKIEQPLVAELVYLLRSDAPTSVILTGTAGDGKTFTARQVAEALSDKGAAWSNTEKVFEIRDAPLKARRLRFIKDLSELNEADKTTIYPEIRAALVGESRDIFVICVNDGHLLKFFRDRDDTALHDKVAEMLRADARKDPDGGFQLINMSRQSHQHLVDQIIDGVVNHPNWSGCEGCPALADTQAPCPIRCNLEILRDTGPASIRARLKDMIRMAAADGRHLSIRQLILLTVNILLGDKKPGAALLTCQRAKNRAKANDYAETNPYANAFGVNLTDKERGQYGAFAVLGEFQVGFETNNYFDHGLLWEINNLPGCAYYGARIFSSLRDRYRGDPAEHAAEFQRQMVDQRRRLFFSIDPDGDDVEDDYRRNPWNLSVFKHGASYVAMVNDLLAGKPTPPKSVRHDLIRGLNRMMTGEMTSTDDQLWITAPAGVFMGQEIPLLVQRAGRPGQGTCEISFSFPADNGRPPVLKVTMLSQTMPSVDLSLRPTLVECLLRIADGALPASFSSESRREVERFQLRSTAAARDAFLRVTTIPKEVEMDHTGKLQEREIAVMTRGDAWE